MEKDTTIAVVFSDNYINSEKLDLKSDNNGVFDFEPELEGKIYWENLRTLIFEPSEKLIERQIKL